MTYTKWVACWGNATSITNQKEAMYSKNLTLRYPVFSAFDGDGIRIHLSNITGTETVTISRAVAAISCGADKIDTGTEKEITFSGKSFVSIKPGCEIVSDETDFVLESGQTVSISLYLEDYTQMNAGVYVSGPMSEGYFSYGNHVSCGELPEKLSRKTNWFYFLNTVDIHTKEENRAIICYGDSITAQSWPDYLKKRAYEEGYRNFSIVRRAVSGTRILREYDNITYAAYGLKGSRRFVIETETAGADTVIIQHGINDIIHPVGTEVNKFRPWSDMPTTEEMTEGVKEIYLKHAKKKGMKVWSGTLLPINGWRTYAPFREKIRNEFNEWLRKYEGFDGCIDFDRAVRDENDHSGFGQGMDSGDHLHPSEAAYKKMAEEVPLDRF